VRIGNPGTVPGTPLALAAAGRDVWAATRDRVVQFSSTGATGIVDATGGVGSVTAAGVDAQGRLWLAGAGTSGIQKVGGNVVETGSDLRLLTLSSGAAWLADTGATSVTQVGLGDLASALPIPVAGPVGALGDAYGRIWVASRNGAVTVLNGDGSRSSLSAPDVTPGTVGIAPSNGVWFLSESGALDRIDPRTDPSVAVGGRYARHPVHIRAGREAAGIGAAAGTDSIWVLSRAERSLTRIGTSGVGNPKVTARVVFPAVPGHLAVGDHVAWVDVPSTRRVYPITF
jgi:hypothetical protein